MSSELWEEQRVEQNHWGFRDKPLSIFTEGLGPCIGVCIAWQKCAALVHSTDIFSDEDEEIAEMIEKMKSIIPKSALPSVRPVVFGGDTLDDSGSGDDPIEHGKGVIRCQKRIIRILQEAGFGKPFVRWNEKGETVDLVADLHQRIVSIFAHHSPHKLAQWRIAGELNSI